MKGPKKTAGTSFPGGRVDAVASFSGLTPDRSRLLALPSSALDEDPAIFPAAVFVQEDEIRARVTLTQIPPESVTADSNVVLRGERIGTIILTSA